MLPLTTTSCDDECMLKNIFRDHHFKIFLSAPIIFLIVMNVPNAPQSGNFFRLQSNKSTFVQIGDQIDVTLKFQTESPVNAVGGTITFTPGIIEVASITRTLSMIDLWSEEPSYANLGGTIQFSGGMLGDKSNTKIGGDVFTANLSMMKEGVGHVSLTNAQLLANNGMGTNITSGQNALTFYIRKNGTASPDVNSDGALSLVDVNTLYIKTFRTYDARYDLNGDGKVNWTDVRALIALL